MSALTYTREDHRNQECPQSYPPGDPVRHILESTRGSELIFRALVDTDGTRDVRFERRSQLNPSRRSGFIFAQASASSPETRLCPLGRIGAASIFASRSPALVIR